MATRERTRLRIAGFGAAASLVAIVLFAFPILSRSGVPLPFCDVQGVFAEDNPCLDREVTISAQQVQILQLQGTMNAQEITNLNLEATIASLDRVTPYQIVIIVPVLITATPNPNATLPIRIVTATPANRLPTTTDLVSVSPSPTATLPPTAANAQVEIIRVLNAGDINAEGVDIRNNRAVIDLSGWQLSDESGSAYTIPQQRLFTGSVMTIYTRVGTDTPTARFWGRDSAVWASGEAVVLTDEQGHVQSVYRVP